MALLAPLPPTWLSRPVREMRRVMRCRMYGFDADSAEQGLPLPAMDSSGVRNRHNPVAATENVELAQHSPTSTAGTLTPSSDGNLTDIQDPVAKEAWLRLPKINFSLSQSKEEIKAFNKSRGYDRFQRLDYQKLPDGFPMTAAFVSSDEDFEMCRGFRNSHNREILHLQIEITGLEKELCERDRAIAASNQNDSRLRSSIYKPGRDDEYKEIREQIWTKLERYDNIVLRHAQMQALGRPPARNHQSYFNWIRSNAPFRRGYDDYILHVDDFLAINGNRSNFFEDAIRNHVNRWPRSPLKKWLRTEEEIAKTDDPHVLYYSPSRLVNLARVVLVSLAVAILLIPVYLLFLVPMGRPMMAVTATSFIVPFTIIMSAVTGAQVYQVFVGAATYGAVLIMFLGNISQAKPR